MTAVIVSNGITEKSVRLDRLESMRASLESRNLIDRETARVLQDNLGVTLPARTPVNSFTVPPSQTNLKAALEAIDQAALEGIVDFFAAIGKAILDFFSWIGEQISKFFSWLFGGGGSSKHSVQETTKAIKELKFNIKPVAITPELQKKIDSIKDLTEDTRRLISWTTEHLTMRLVEASASIKSYDERLRARDAKYFGMFTSDGGRELVGYLNSAVPEMQQTQKLFAEILESDTADKVSLEQIEKATAAATTMRDKLEQFDEGLTKNGPHVPDAAIAEAIRGITTNGQTEQAVIGLATLLDLISPHKMESTMEWAKTMSEVRVVNSENNSADQENRRKVAEAVRVLFQVVQRISRLIFGYLAYFRIVVEGAKRWRKLAKKIMELKENPKFKESDIHSSLLPAWKELKVLLDKSNFVDIMDSDDKK